MTFTDEMVATLSPNLDRLRALLIVAYGIYETPEFQRQARAFFAAVRDESQQLRYGCGLNFCWAAPPARGRCPGEQSERVRGGWGMTGSSKTWTGPGERNRDGTLTRRRVLGGVGTLVGPIVGAAFFLLQREGLSRFFTEFYLIPVGIVFILMVIFMP